MIVDDQEAYSTGLVNAMMPVFKKAGHQGRPRVGQPEGPTDFSSLVSKLTPDETVVVLPWQVAANAQQFGRNLASSTRRRSSSAPTAPYSPGTFTIPGSLRVLVRTRHHERSRRQGDRGGRQGEVRPVRHVRPADVRGHARDRRGDRRRSASQGRRRAGATCWRRSSRPTSRPRSSATPIKFAANGDLVGEKVLPVQDQFEGQVRPDPERVID